MKRAAIRSAAAMTVDDYLAGFPSEIQVRLQRLREAIRKTAPQAEESISYRIPAYKQQGVLIYFAGFERHIGLYPLTAAVKAEFQQELKPYLSG